MDKIRELAPFITSKVPSLRMKDQIYTMCCTDERDIGHKNRTGVKDGKDGYDDHQFDVLCVPG